MEIARSLQHIQPSYIREILVAASDESIISLAGGLPDPASFPLALMASSFNQLATMPGVFQYGATAGYPPLIDYLTAHFQLDNSHTLMITTGSQQGLDLLARAYINPGDNVVMEAPSYLGAMQVFNLAQANICAVSQTENGPDIAALEQCFRTQNPKLFYAVPDFHNPTGVCWSQEVRQRVARLCIKYNVTLIEDAPYRDLRFKGKPLKMVSDLCPEHAIVLRSFSKVASPGLRIGVISGKASYIAPLVTLKQSADLHSSVPTQVVLLDLLQQDGYLQHVDTVCRLYYSRYQTLFCELQQHLPANCGVQPVVGGMFLWVTLPECNTLALAKRLLSDNVAVVPGDVFYPSKIQAQSALRLNFTNATSTQLKTAVTLLANTLTTFLERQQD